MHIAIASLSMTGHINPVMRIGQALKEKGHKVTLLTSKQWLESKSGAAGKFSLDLQGIRLVAVDDGMSDNIASDLDNLRKKYGLKLPRSIVRKYRDIVDAAAVAPFESLHAKDPIEFAVVDYFGSSFMRQFTAMGVEFIVNLPCSASQLWLWEVDGAEDKSWMTWAQCIENFVLKHVLFAHLLKDVKAFASFRPWLSNSFPELDSALGVPSLPSQCKYCGTLGHVPGGTLEGEFDAFFKGAAAAQLPVICVSLGSMVRPDAVIINAIYNGLAGGPWLVVWSLYDNGVKLLPAVDTKQFLLTKWIPQAAILAQQQCKLFVTHGGWGGLMEAAASGKPVLCLPFFGDQPSNAKMIEKSGWGLSLSPQNIDPIEAVMEPPPWTGKLKPDEVRAKAAKILETPSFPQAAEKISSGALQYGGRSGAAVQVEEWARLSKQGVLPKPVKAQKTGCLGLSFAAWCC